MADKDLLDAKGEDDKDLDLEVVEDESLLDKGPEKKPLVDDDDDEDEDLRGNAESQAENPDDREKARLAKENRKKRRAEAIRRDKTEINFLRQQNDQLERRMAVQEQRAVQSDVSSMDYHIDEAKKQITMAEQVFAKATAAGNGEDAMQAMRYRDEARDKLARYTYAKTQQTAQLQQQQGQPAQRDPDPKVVQNARAFMTKHNWYNPDPNNQDEDSAITYQLDRAVVRDGFDPRTEEYWTELESRMRKRLPERFEGQEQRQTTERKPSGGPAIASGRGSGAAGSNKVYLNPDRVQAMKDAGVWEDPKLRARYTKRYLQFDKENAGR